ncbi:unnamed protein product [Rhizophagus irregularis]|uniref:Uncharacterized protein n=1 Tax=Rhizophagus irregularis TaxID=588596 RepID=A0A915ZCQ9_9GLOM|nr:unnamed protein product [Rhizophagus irregularis]
MTPEFEQKDPDFYKQNYVNGVYLNYASPDSPTSSKRDSRGSVKRHSFYVLRENKSFNRRGIMLRIVIRIIYDASRIPLLSFKFIHSFLQIKQFNLLIDIAFYLRYSSFNIFSSLLVFLLAFFYLKIL